MSIISPGWQTDLAILEMTGSQLHEGDGYTVVTTPGNPDYRWGNCILVHDQASVADASRWIGQYRNHFPSNDWIAIGLPDYPTNTESWDSFGITLEKHDVLTATYPPAKPEIPAGYSVRQFTAADWAALVKLEIQDDLDLHLDELDVIESFVKQTNLDRKKLCDEGNAAWFGAFSGTTLVASLGIVVCGSDARYQSVQTVQDHCRKGLASHLLGVAAEWAKAQNCNRWVIVTEETNTAGRVYRKAGFSSALPMVNAFRRLTS